MNADVKEELFCSLVVRGKCDLPEAARRAFRLTTTKSAIRKAGKLMDKPAVVQKIAALQMERTNEKCMDIIDKRLLCKQIAEDEELSVGDRIKAIEMDSKLADHFPTQKQQTDIHIGLEDISTRLDRELRACEGQVVEVLPDEG